MGYKSAKEQQDYQRDWYQRNKQRLSEKFKQYRKTNKPRLIRWFSEYKVGLACVKCGESHPACLQFHHRDPSTKRFTVSAAVRLCVCIEEVMEEIRKCDVLCGNCHAKLHYEENVERLAE